MANGIKALGVVGVVAAAAAAGGGKGLIKGGEVLFADSGRAAIRGSATAGTHAALEGGTWATRDTPKAFGLSNHLDSIIPRNNDLSMTLGLNRDRTYIGSNEISNTDRTSNLGDLLTSKSVLNARNQVHMMNLRPFIRPFIRPFSGAIHEYIINQDKHEMSGKVSALFVQAEPKILDRLDINAGMPTQAEIKKVIREELTKTAEKAVSQPNSAITFEALTGKLKIYSCQTVFGDTVTGGEVNIYNISGTLGAGVVACGTLAPPELKNCAKAALAKIGSAVAQELKLEATNSSKEGSDK